MVHAAESCVSVCTLLIYSVVIIKIISSTSIHRRANYLETFVHSSNVADSKQKQACWGTNSALNNDVTAKR